MQTSSQMADCCTLFPPPSLGEDPEYYLGAQYFHLCDGISLPL